MVVLLWLHRPTRPLAMSSLSMCSSRGSTQPPFAKPPVVGSACHRLPAKYLSWSEWDTGPADLATVAMAKRIRCRFSVYARARVVGSYSESEKASQHRKMPSNAVAALLLSGRNRQRRFPGTTLMMHGRMRQEIATCRGFFVFRGLDRGRYSYNELRLISR